MKANELRPRKLQDVIGQDKVVKSINKYLKDSDYPNVSCFAGSSGCGKNTLGNIVSCILQSENPIINGEWIEPDFNDPAVVDIINEKFQRDVHVYSGNEITADVLKDEIETIISYSSNDKNVIIQINEAQLCKNLKRLLEIVETPRKNVYWIFTSTDVKKFTSTFSKDNKQQEANAFRSRLTLFQILPVTERDLVEKVGYPLVDIYNEEHKDNPLDESFDDIVFFIAKNCAHNVRQMINDLTSAINAECKTKEDVMSLLGYTDEVAEYDAVVGVCNKSKSSLEYFRNSTDLEGNVVYMRKILADACLRMASGIPYEEDWKEKAYKNMEASGNLLKVCDMLNELAKYPYYNDGIFMTVLCKYYLDKTNTTNNVRAPMGRTPIHG